MFDFGTEMGLVMIEGVLCVVTEQTREISKMAVRFDFGSLL